MVTWVVDTYLNDPHTESMANVVKTLGFNCIETQYVPFSKSTDVEVPEDDFIFAYGTIGFMNQMADKFGGRVEESVHHITNPHSFSYSRFLQYYRLFAFNHPVGITPIGNLPRALKQMSNLDTGYFVRPDMPFKSFKGQVVSAENYEEFCATLKYEHVNSGEDAYICPNLADKILGEYRFVCRRGQILASSQYRWKGVLDIRSDIHPAANKFAQGFIATGRGPHEVFVMDVVVDTNYNAHIMEFNPVFSSGMYNCHKQTVIRGITELYRGHGGGAVK